jgi:cell division initiation protein
MIRKDRGANRSDGPAPALLRALDSGNLGYTEACNRGEAMDRMMPVDLERVDLKKSFRGFERTQVQTLLQRAAQEMAALRKEADTLRDERAKLARELETYRGQEDTLKEALILAQRTADETRASARTEADLIIEAARQKAAEAESALHTKVNDLRWELERLRLDRQKFLSSYRGMLETQLRDIAEMGGFAIVEGEPEASVAEA